MTMSRWPQTRDLIGVGFGPSNLALAIALEEHNQRGDAVPLDAVFLERQPRFGWHRGMLIDGATMQVSFLKDLVTMRDPASRFSFLSYLSDRERLADFINSKSLFPTREEFHDYLEWAAGQLDHLVRYDCEVVRIHPVWDHDRVEQLDVVVRGRNGGEGAVHRARNVALAPGLRPDLPPGVTPSARIWHNHDLLDRVATLPSAPARFVVVGAGQSAAEATEHLHRRFPSAEVCAVFARYGYSASDDTPFANRIFDPDAVDHFFDAPDDVKRRLVSYHRDTNYSVVDPDLIAELYRRSYQEKVTGQRRLRILNVSEVIDVEELAGGVRVVVEFLPTGERRTLAADAVVYATGYRPVDPTELLGEVAPLCQRTATGKLAVERDYRVRTTDDLRCGIYVQGPTEHTHGITSTLLSNTAVRVGEIVDSVRHRSAPPSRRSPSPVRTGVEAGR